MKLYELTGIKHMYEKDLEDIISSLESSGTKVMGRGSFALVLKNSSKNEVIKFWIKDSSYDDFINYVIKNPSKYFPKVYSKPKELSAFFLRPADFPDKIKYVRMEELDKVIDVDADYIESMIKDCMHADESELVDYTEEWSEIAISHVLELIGDGSKESLLDFAETMKKMTNYLVKHQGHKLDIHDENIMIRNGKELVITDPIYNRKDYESSDKIRSAIRDIKRWKDDPDFMKDMKTTSGRKKEG